MDLAIVVREIMAGEIQPFACASERKQCFPMPGTRSGYIGVLRLVLLLKQVYRLCYLLSLFVSLNTIFEVKRLTSIKVLSESRLREG